MRTKSPSENIPNLDNLYETLREFVKEHQGEKGYIDTDWKKCGADTIHGYKYDDVAEIYMEETVFGVRVENNDVQVLMKPWMRTYHNAPTEDELEDGAYWESLKQSCCVDYIPTLFAVSENIEEYIED